MLRVCRGPSFINAPGGAVKAASYDRPFGRSEKCDSIFLTFLTAVMALLDLFSGTKTEMSTVSCTGWTVMMLVRTHLGVFFSMRLFSYFLI
ncbi:hypothetical protein CEXT_15801 [Caerostris extrusa]|uniref:Uncharacterized protein n=1 Tax=Caerostris extrusa TaxID=172846 RepID=A0AAV4RBT4_CAEEX|nr:hypothetical protein CEXT_15801 [Caerostris extrusa]